MSIRKWIKLIEDSGKIAPDVGSSFEYKGNIYYVKGWLKEAVPPKSHPHPQSHWLDDMIWASTQEVGPENKKLVFCKRKDADYVSGSGVSGVIARIEDIKLIHGRQKFDSETLDKMRAFAMRLVGTTVF